MKRAFLLIVLMLGLAVPAAAQPVRDPLLDRQITDFVRRIFQDSRGDMWFGTHHHGVYRFDGRSFRRFGAQDGLLSTAVQCTCQDPQGRIWVGGYLGLYRLNGEEFVNLTAESPWP